MPESKVAINRAIAESLNESKNHLNDRNDL